MKNVKLLMLGIVMLSCFNVVDVKAKGNTLPDKDENGKIKLTDDVDLEKTFEISSDENITIDLDGHTINYSSPISSYAISNLGTVKIIDSKGQGKIVCTQTRGSCIRNIKTMVIDGVSIESNWLTVKNEELGNLTVTNSKIAAKRVDQPSVAIQNWGTAVIDNCDVIGDGEGTIAISDLSYTEEGVKYSSEITVKNSRLNAPYAVDSRSYDGGETTQKITFENITVESGNIRVEKGATFVSESKENTLNAIKNATSGSTIVVSDDFVASNLDIPEGVTVELGEDNDTLERVEKDGKVSFIRKENNQTNPIQPEVVEELEVVENPDTSDINLYLLLSLLITSICGITYSVNKKIYSIK